MAAVCDKKLLKARPKEEKTAMIKGKNYCAVMSKISLLM